MTIPSKCSVAQKIRPILFSREDVARSLIKIIYGVINRVVTIRYVYKLDLDQVTFRPENMDFTFKEMPLSDLKVMHSLNTNEISIRRHEYLKKIIKDPTSNCYMIKNIAGDICGYCVLEFGVGMHSGILAKIKRLNVNETGYMSRDYTFKKYRGKAIQKFSVYRRLMILKDKGFKTAVTRIAATNTISNRNYRKVGFEKIAVEIHFPLLNMLPLPNILVFHIRKNK